MLNGPCEWKQTDETQAAFMLKTSFSLLSSGDMSAPQTDILLDVKLNTTTAHWRRW